MPESGPDVSGMSTGGANGSVGGAASAGTTGLDGGVAGTTGVDGGVTGCWGGALAWGRTGAMWVVGTGVVGGDGAGARVGWGRSSGQSQEARRSAAPTPASTIEGTSVERSRAVMSAAKISA